MRLVLRPILAGFLACGILSAQGLKIFDSLQYRFIGPANMGGRTTDIEGVPGNPAIVYAGTGGGGLWKTTNGGVTWIPLWEREGSLSVGDLALDPRNPDVVWLGSGEANMRNSVSFGDGIYKSTDGGKSWTHLGLRETEHIARVLVSPLDSSTAWVCAVGHQAAPNPERGVFLTNDGGKTWTKTLFVDDSHGCADMDIDPGNPNVVYASLWRFERKPWTHTSGSEQSGLFKSIDGGRTWKKLTKGLPKLMGRMGVKVAPSNPNVVYVAVESKEGTFYRSGDAGESWTEMTRKRDVVARGFYYADLRVDPQDESRVYAVASLLQLSIDGGKTWKRISQKTHIDYHTLWIDPSDPRRMWEGSDGGLGVSYDRGETWEAVQNIPLGQYYQIHTDNREPFYNVTGGLQDNGTWTGPSRVRQPTGITNAEWSMVSFGDGFFAYTHPDNPDLFLTESQGGSIIQSDFSNGEMKGISPQPRSGRVWDLKYRFNWNTPIMGSAHGKNTVYFGSNVLFQSRDFGKSWEPISGDLTTSDPEKLKPAGGPVWFDNSTAENHCTIISIGESPAKAGVLWAGTDDGNLQFTSDGGRTWTNLSKNVTGMPAGSPVSHVEPSHTGVETAYVAFDRHLLDDYRPHIFLTSDAGRTWTRIVDGLPEKAYVHIVREDPKNPKLLYAGTELGLFVSLDAGRAWQPFLLKNLPKVAIHDIAIHPRENDLILASHGRSIVVFDDISPLQQVSPTVTGKPAHLFTVRHAYRYATPMRLYGPGDKAYVAPNPPYGALISYYLKDKVDEKAALKIEILDAQGNLVRELEKPSRDAGIQRIAWDLRYKAQELRSTPEGIEVEFGGGPRGPQVLPGNYTVRLTVGETREEQRFEVKLDPNLKSTSQNLLAQRDLALKLRDLISEMSVALKRLDSLEDQLDEAEKLGKRLVPDKSQEWSKTLDSYRKEVQRVSRAMAVRRDGYRLEESPQIAEDLSDLYGDVMGGNSAPTAAEIALAAELESRYRKQMADARKVLDTQVPQWNEALRKLGAPGLVTGAANPQGTAARP